MKVRSWLLPLLLASVRTQTKGTVLNLEEDDDDLQFFCGGGTLRL